ncbi:helix-turn-helix domain-containing protein [Paenibacillus pinisoli]|uniref:Helix-turn-helix domain-containing protein n=1 Tax=Paenibacillus pinisoli TaxID=1276110 RepID=A0A3A6PLW5_9BACL|nr:AraC family transcriptional regulator [Paenibacillus pinisoli]RJX40348.1 helix-turn-helix domain-containing protein [Paenibacillus pinisoli]
MVEHEHLALWNHASIRVLDIRHMVMREGEELRAYQLPASMFLFAVRGGAVVTLNGTDYPLRPFHVLHGGKGSVMDIRPHVEQWECDLIYYKAALPLPSRQDLAELLARSNPFTVAYQLMPDDPLSLFRIVEAMRREWEIAGPFERFQVKSMFYELAGMILQQLHRKGNARAEPDLATRALRYMEKHYADPISLDSLAASFNYSAAHLSDVFKKATGYSPIDYLLRIRMEKAASLLADTEASIREIASYVGYGDPYYFGRIFKKMYGVSPLHYRKVQVRIDQSAKSPSAILRSSVAGERKRDHTDNDNCYQNQSRGDISMYKSFSSTTAATLLLCLTLVLSACSGGNVASNTGNGTGTSPNVTENASSGNPQTSTADKETRTVVSGGKEIQIPANPKRIVADQYLGSLIVLGVTPIGTPGLHWENPYLADFLNGVEDIGDVNGSLEKVIDLQPDLIITGAAADDARYQQLSKIAPTLSIPYGELKNAHEELTYFGELLGKENEAKAWLEDYDRRITAAREKAHQAVPEGATFSIIEWTDNSIYTYGDNFGRGGQAVYQALGFKPPAGIAAEIMEKQWASLTNEALPQYAGDYIILTSNDRSVEDVKGDPIWGTLEAVKNERIYVWKEEHSWYYDPIAVLSQTEELAGWLAGLK